MELNGYSVAVEFVGGREAHYDVDAPSVMTAVRYVVSELAEETDDEISLLLALDGERWIEFTKLGDIWLPLNLLSMI